MLTIRTKCLYYCSLLCGLLATQTCFAISAELFFLGQFAPSQGFIQIPTGGKPGTATLRRPTLAELGINEFDPTSYYTTGFRSTFGRLGAYGEYQYNCTHATHTLSNDLTTRNIFIPHDTNLTSTNLFNFYRAGGQYLFCNNFAFTFAPEVEIASLMFSYHIIQPTNVPKRNFTPITGRIGFVYSYHLIPRIEGRFEAITTLPHASNLQAQNLNLDIEFTLLQLTALQARIIAGVGYQRIDYQDKQQEPNHIEIIANPIARIGIGISL